MDSLTVYQSLPEKLQLKDEKNILVQGLPSTIEKQFSKISFSKNVTPLLKLKKIDFALIFAVNQKQLTGILTDVVPALHNEAKLWIAYPKPAAKIASDLTRMCNWDCVENFGFNNTSKLTVDHVWNVVGFKKATKGSKSKVTELALEEIED